MSDQLVSRDTWLKKRLELLDREKAFTKERDALTAARQQLPMVLIQEDYEFDTETGPKTLADLFDGKKQLIVYHFMFGPDWAEGCRSCSFWCDHFNGIDVHLAARDTALVIAANAPLQTLLDYRDRMGWTLNWVSAGRTKFGQDFGVTFPKSGDDENAVYNYTGRPYGDESPGLSVFTRLEDGRVAHSYSTYGRGLDILNTAYHLLDMTPKGRDEGSLTFTMEWLKRRDEYQTAAE